MLYAVKILIAAAVIAFCSGLAGKKPILAGFITALPLVSILAITLAYFEHRDMAKINLYALSIMTAVPLSLTFFLPFFLNKWLHMNCIVTLMIGLLMLFLAYKVHGLIFKLY